MLTMSGTQSSCDLCLEVCLVVVFLTQDHSNDGGGEVVEHSTEPDPPRHL